MVRLAAFFIGVMLLYGLLSRLPVVGPFFHHLGCFGVWITAIALSWAVTRYGERAVRVGRDRAAIRRLLAVGSPYNHGKVGTMYLHQGRLRRALEHLERAVAGEPDVAEWHYRRGCALALLKRDEQAVEALQRCVTLEEEHAYGAAQLRLAETLVAAGRDAEALDALAVFERNHGPVPESAYRRGLAWKRLGKAAEARAAFAEVSRLSAEAARYQRRDAGFWTLRAKLAQLF